MLARTLPAPSVLGVGRIALLGIVLLSIAVNGRATTTPTDTANAQTALRAPFAKSIAFRWQHRLNPEHLGTTRHYYQYALTIGVGARHVVVPYEAGFVKAFDKNNGRFAWSHTTDEAITSGVALEGRTAYVGGEDGGVVAIHTLSGARLWRQTLSHSVLRVHADDARLYAFLWNGNVVAMNKQDGGILWRYIGSEPAASIYGIAPPFVANDTLWFGTSRGELIQLNAASGRLINQRIIATPRGFSAQDVLVDIGGVAGNSAGDTIFVSAFRDALYALNSRTQTIHWQYPMPSVKPLRTEGETLFVQTDDDILAAYDTITGARRWQNDALRFQELSLVHIAGAALIMTDREGTLWAVDKTTGEVLARYRGDAPLAIEMGIDNANSTLGKRTTDAPAFFYVTQQGVLAAAHLADNPFLAFPY